MHFKRLTILIALVLWLPTTSATAQPTPNIVVMGEDADEDSVPRGNRIFQRVIQALAETMNVRGYNVYDETAIAMDITEPGRVRRRDAELIDVARSVQAPPVDVIAIFQIYASAQKSTYSDIVRPEIRIPGRLLNVATGQQIGSFEVGGLELPPLPVGCDRECLLERVGDNAVVIANDLAAALTAKLDGFAGGPAPSGLTFESPDDPLRSGPTSAQADGCGGMPTAFVIRLQGFDTLETSAVEEYLNAFSCVQHSRPVRASNTSAEYWYETRADSARVNRNLRLMLEHMNVNGQVQFAGNTFIVTKVATR